MKNLLNWNYPNLFSFLSFFFFYSDSQAFWITWHCQTFGWEKLTKLPMAPVTDMSHLYHSLHRLQFGSHGSIPQLRQQQKYLVKTWTLNWRTFSTENVLKQLIKPESSTAKWVDSNLAVGKLRHKDVKWPNHSTSMVALGLQLRKLISSSVLSFANYPAFVELAANKYSYKQRAQKISLSSCFSRSCKQTCI